MMEQILFFVFGLVSGLIWEILKEKRVEQK